MIVKSKNYVFIFSLVLSSKMATNEAPRVELESLLDTDKSNLKQIVCLKVIIWFSFLYCISTFPLRGVRYVYFHDILMGRWQWLLI